MGIGTRIGTPRSGVVRRLLLLALALGLGAGALLAWRAADHAEIADRTRESIREAVHERLTYPVDVKVVEPTLADVLAQDTEPPCVECGEPGGHLHIMTGSDEDGLQVLAIHSGLITWAPPVPTTGCASGDYGWTPLHVVCGTYGHHMCAVGRDPDGDLLVECCHGQHDARCEAGP